MEAHEESLRKDSDLVTTDGSVEASKKKQNDGKIILSDAPEDVDEFKRWIELRKLEIELAKIQIERERLNLSRSGFTRIGPILVPLLAAIIAGSVAIFITWFQIQFKNIVVQTERTTQAVEAQAEAARNQSWRLQQQVEGIRSEIERLRPPTPSPPTPSPPQPTPDIDRGEGEGARSGALQFLLAWDTKDDLDLIVICPNGEEVSYRTRRACGGQFDIDRNIGEREATDRPIENIFWNNPGAGRYQIFVTLYTLRGTAPVPFRVTVRRAGQQDQHFTGSAREKGTKVSVGEVTIPNSNN